MHAMDTSDSQWLLDLLKSIALLPVGALFYFPFLRLAARILRFRQLSHGGAFMLALILSVATFVPDLAIRAVLAEESVTAMVLLIAVSTVISTVVCGYLVRNAEGLSIGIKAGLVFTLVSDGLFTLALAAIAGLLFLLFIAFT